MEISKDGRQTRERYRCIVHAVTRSMLPGIVLLLVLRSIGAYQLAQTNHYEDEAADLANQWEQTSVRRSIDLYLKAEKEWLQIGKVDRSAHCLREAASLLTILAEYPSATSLLDRAVAIESNIGHTAGVAQALSQLSLIKLAEGKTLEGQQISDNALKLARRSADPTALAQAFFSAAEFSYYTGNSEGTVELNREAAANAVLTGITKLQAHTGLGLAYAYSLHGDPVSALATAQNSLSKWQAIGHRRGEALTLVAIGNIYALMGNKNESMLNYQLALSMFPQDIDLLEKARLLNGIAGVYSLYSEWEISRIYNNRAYDLFKQVNYPTGQLATLPSLLKSSYLSSRTGPKEDVFHEAVRLAKRLNNQLYLGFTYEVLGSIYFDQDKTEESVHYLRLSLTAFRSLNFKRGIVRVQNLLGAALLAAGDRVNARQSLQEALASSIEIKSGTDEAAIEYNLARLNALQDRDDEALAGIRKSIHFGDTEHSDVLNSKLRMAYFSDLSDRYKLYVSLLMKRHWQSRSGELAVQALQASERSRARIILENILLADADLTNGSALPAVTRENDLRVLLSAKRDRLTDLLGRTGDVGETEKLDSEIKELENELEATKADLKLSSPVYAEIKDPPPFDVENFQENMLDENSILLEFLLGKEESYLWVVDKKEVAAFVLPGRDEIEGKVEGLRTLLTARQPRGGETIDEHQTRAAAAERAFSPAARELSNMLLGAAAEKLSNKRLILVPDGKLHYFPFSALPLPNTTDDRSMVLTNEVVYQPSAQTLTLLTKMHVARAIPDRRDLLIYSDPVFSADDDRLSGVDLASSQTAESKYGTFRFVESLASLTRLPGSRTEALAVMESTGIDSADSFSGFAATRERLLGMDLSAYKVLHFATHGIVFDQRPDLSGIVLSRYGEQGQPLNEFIRIQDIYGMKLNADLVVLSACDTGIGKEIKGEGIMSLNTAFLQSGARSVLASLWKVEDGATQKLMKEFYAGISTEGLKPSESLRRAQIELAKDPRYSSPFYWAAFTLQGDPDVNLLIGRRYISPWPLATIPILFVVAYLLWNRRTRRR